MTKFSQLQNSFCVQILHSAILTALLHSTQAVGVSQSLRHGTRNGITELSQRAPPIFGREAITLGIRPHCSLFCIIWYSINSITVVEAVVVQVSAVGG